MVRSRVGETLYRIAWGADAEPVLVSAPVVEEHEAWSREQAVMRREGYTITEERGETRRVHAWEEEDGLVARASSQGARYYATPVQAWAAERDLIALRENRLRSELEKVVGKRVAVALGHGEAERDSAP